MRLTCWRRAFAFTAYSWFLKVSTRTRISTFAYMNPVIAFFLDWAMGGKAHAAHRLGSVRHCSRRGTHENAQNAAHGRNRSPEPKFDESNRIAESRKQLAHLCLATQ